MTLEASARALQDFIMSYVNPTLVCYTQDERKQEQQKSLRRVSNEADIEPGEVMWLGGSVPKLDAMYRDVEESSIPCIIITRFSADAINQRLDCWRDSTIDTVV